MPYELTFVELPCGGGQLRYAKVPWDSDLFGFPVYELRCDANDPESLSEPLDQFLSLIRKDGAALVCSKIPSSEVTIARVLVARGFYPVETSFGLSLSLPAWKPLIPARSDAVRLRQAGEGDLPRLATIARSAFRSDRFHLDPNLSSLKADERYGRWVEDGFHRGDPLFLYEDLRGGLPLGFFHVRPVGAKTIDLTLGAVAAEQQGRGFGPLMYQAILSETREQGYDFATARISANNLDIVNLLARLGFAFRRAVTAFHWYRSEAEGGSLVQRS